MTEPERWLDQFLGDPVGEAARDEVLAALRGHIHGSVVIEVENADGTTAEHAQGKLVEASRAPDWDTAEFFAVVTSAATNVWHCPPGRLGELARRGPYLARAVAEASGPPLFTFGVPDAGITGYLGPDAGSAG